MLNPPAALTYECSVTFPSKDRRSLAAVLQLETGCCVERSFECCRTQSCSTNAPITTQALAAEACTRYSSRTGVEAWTSYSGAGRCAWIRDH